MKVLNQDTKQSFEISFQSWKTDLYPKKKFTVAEWGDLVMLRAIEQFGDRKDIEIMEREAAMKRIKNDPYKYDFRVATHQDLQSLRGKYLIADDYIEGLTFNELFEKQYRHRYFKPTFKETLIGLYQEGLISSLPVDLNRSGVQYPVKKQETPKATNKAKLKAWLSSHKADIKWGIGISISLGIFIIGYLTNC